MGMSRRTVVVKVGSTTVTGADGRVDRAFLKALVDQLAALRSDGYAVVLVTSGAVAAGLEALGMTSRPKDIPTIQAAAAIGQVRLVETYAELAAERDMAVGQVLFTRQDVGHRQQYLNACHTLEKLLDLGVVPVVNENDTTAVDEIRFGDNDYLAALVGVMVHAELVVLLTDIEGLYSSDPRSDVTARLVERVEELTDEVLASAGGAGSAVGSGGMATKLEAARLLMDAGIPLIVCDGRRENVVEDAVGGKPVGTLFAGGKAALRGRKLWLAYAGRTAGSVSIDDGARDALCLRGGSLLPAGVTDVSGSFVVGDAITLADANGVVVARGIAGMSAEDLRKVKGMRSSQIAAVLPGWDGTEVVHRDHLVIV
ncbi:MAG: glutamate 5-kinase [Actinobacteria bacterium HGW-Actinobacteria-1]|nr:MAG: glutamate 5-kinase [Actinobacteria bacterium HGW-Actinobacteria-1]